MCYCVFNFISLGKASLFSFFNNWDVGLMLDSTHQGLVGRAGLTTPTDEGALKPRTGSA